MDATRLRRRLKASQWAALLLSVGLIGASLLLLGRADAGLEVRFFRIGPTPISVYRELETAGDSAPVVIVSHGFAGSRQLMEPFAVTLAKNGYLAVTFDYYGHGRNLEPLSGDVTEVEGATRELVAQTREIVDFALGLPGAGNGLALLGHSMASDIVVRFARADARVDATVAVSMFSPAVTADSPSNLLIIVGGLEGFLKAEALRVLAMVTDDPAEGRTFGSFEEGSARRVVFADGVEHVGVLYSVESMREATEWLDQVFERSGSGYADSRGGAIVMLIVGVGLLAWPLSALLPVVSQTPRGASLDWRRLLPAALIPALVTPLLLGPFPADFLGVLVGGYLAVHFLVYGLVTAACLWWLRRDTGPTDGAAVDPRRLLIAAALSAAYVAGVVALVMDSYVTSFAINAPRLPLVLLMITGTLSYFLADEWLTRGADTARFGHLFTRVCFLLSLGIAVALSFEDLFFLVIIAAVIVVYFLIYGLFSAWIYRRTGHPAIAAIANAVAFAWALAAVFPIMSG